MRSLVLMVALLGAPAMLRWQSPESGVKAMPVAAALPYIDSGVCPGEGCQYAVWTAKKATTVYDTWNDERHPIARVSNGEKETGITGIVVTEVPGTIRMDRDLVEKGLHTGDTILTYTYIGEGFSEVWFKGKFYPEFDISFAKWPDGSGCQHDCAATYVDLGKKVWWAKVKLKSGHTGWVNMEEAQFDGIDALRG